MRKKLNELEGQFCALVLAVMLAVLGLQVLLRWLGKANTWSEELGRFLFEWLVYVGGSYATAKGAHIAIDFALNLWPKKLRPLVKVIGNLLWLAFIVVIIYHSQILVRNAIVNKSYSIALGTNMAYAYAAIPVGYFLMAIRLIQFEIIPNIRALAGKADATPKNGGEEDTHVS